MVVEIISVGTELLLGNTINTNGAYLGEKCAMLGLSCYHQSVIGDNEERLMESIKMACTRADILILTGGLGPTQDDMTKEAVAKAFHKVCVMDEQSKECMKLKFLQKGLEMTENNWKQAMVIEGCIVIENENGIAPGIILEVDQKRIILLPGPPNELIPMFEGQITNYLKNLQSDIIYSQIVKICGMSESKVETIITDLIENQGNPTIATYAKTGEVHLRVTAKAEDEKIAKRLLKPMIRELKNRFGSHIYTTSDDTTLEKSVVELLIANKLSISIVESCTGGMLSARLVNVAGISEVFKAGFITYSNKSKRRMLGVKKTTLDKHGAVSEQVAKEMLKGALLSSKSEVAVSITGIAGPDGGTKDKPVGTTYIGCSVCGKVTIQQFQFLGNREKIRENAVSAALTLLRSCILEYYSKITFGDKK